MRAAGRYLTGHDLDESGSGGFDDTVAGGGAGAVAGAAGTTLTRPDTNTKSGSTSTVVFAPVSNGNSEFSSSDHCDDAMIMNMMYICEKMSN